MLSFTEENYLKALWHLTMDNTHKEEAGTNELAAHLNVKPATANDMLKKLKEKKLVDYKKYGKSSLTNIGKKLAIEVVRKHRLWETFLYEKLEFTWDKVHEVAEQLEHIKSQKLVDKLDKFLNYPAFDPHGDPIPDEHGKVKKMKTQPLNVAPLEMNLTIVSLANTSNEFLKYLDKVGLTIGDTIKVSEIEEFDKSVTIMHKKNSIILSNEAASNLFVAI